MRVGLMFPISSDPGRIVRFAGAAEEMGYDFVGCGEHLFFHGPVTNAFVTLAAAAAVTTRVRLLSALTILPLYPAVLAAKQAATLDRLSGGRFDLGVGVGGEHPPEFAAAGSPLRSRGRRTDDGLELLRQLFTGEPVSLSTPEVHLDGLALDPAPVHAGGPPIWIGGRKEVALRRVARFGDVWFPYVLTADQMANGMARLADLTAEAGRPDGAVRGGFFGWGAVDRSGARAKETAVRQVSNVYQQDFTPLADKLLVTGTPGEVLDRLGTYAEAGVEEFLFAPAADDDDTVDGMIELFATEVLPHLR